KRPLTFFIPDSSDPEKGILHNDMGDFSAQLVNGSMRAIEQKIIMTVKPRKVVVLTSDEINQNNDFEYILVAPINTIKPQEKQKNWYQLLKEDQHPIFVYIPFANYERYVDLTQTTTIHKSLLLKKLNKVNPDRIDALEENLLHCLSLGILEDTEEIVD